MQPNQEPNQPVPTDTSAEPLSGTPAAPSEQHPNTAAVPPEPPKRKSKMWLMLAAALAVLIVGGGAAWVLMRGGDPKQEAANTQQTSDETADDSNVDYSNKQVAFGLPSPTPEGWTNTAFDRDGDFIYKSASCVLSFNQSRGASESAVMGNDIDDAVQYWADYLTRSGAESLTYEPSAEQLQLSVSGQSGKIKFTTVDVSYSAADGLARSGKLGVVWLGDTQLTIIITCDAATWPSDQHSMALFLGQTDVAITDQ